MKVKDLIKLLLDRDLDSEVLVSVPASYSATKVDVVIPTHSIKHGKFPAKFPETEKPWIEIVGSSLWKEMRCSCSSCKE